MEDNCFTHAAQQQAHEADHAIEVPFEICFVFGVFRVQFGHTSQATWRLMREPLGSAAEDNC